MSTQSDSLFWSDLDDKHICVTHSASEVYKLSRRHMLCINGDVLDSVIHFAESASTVRFIDVFSRTSPTQKGIIVGMLNLEGHKTLMCGDGTNDVGSLKRAHVGLAIVNNKEMSKEMKKKKKAMSVWPDKAKLEGKNM